MSSSSSSTTRTRQERLESSVFTGSQLTDMHLLAETDDETFRKLCNTNFKLRDICTNPRYEQQLYEMRVQTRFPEYHHLFGENWGQFLDEDQLAKVTKPTWKEIYQKLVNMKRVNALSLLTHEEPLSDIYHIDDRWGLIAVMGEYPEIVKFVYPVNPAPFSLTGAYANSVWENPVPFSTTLGYVNYVWVGSPKKWKGILEILRWLLELDEFEPTSALLTNAAKIGYGPFIRYLVEKRGLVLNRDEALVALLNGAGDILDLVTGAGGEDLENNVTTQIAGMKKALERGNIEGLEAFQQRGFRLSNRNIETYLESYPKETIKWLRDNGYGWVSHPLFLEKMINNNKREIVKAIKELDRLK